MRYTLGRGGIKCAWCVERGKARDGIFLRIVSSTECSLRLPKFKVVPQASRVVRPEGTPGWD